MNVTSSSYTLDSVVKFTIRISGEISNKRSPYKLLLLRETERKLIG